MKTLTPLKILNYKYGPASASSSLVGVLPEQGPLFSHILPSVPPPPPTRPPAAQPESLQDLPAASRALHVLLLCFFRPPRSLQMGLLRRHTCFIKNLPNVVRKSSVAMPTQVPLPPAGFVFIVIMGIYFS